MNRLEKFIEEYSGGEYNSLGILKNKKKEIAELIQEVCELKVINNYDTYYRDEGKYGISMVFSADLIDKKTNESVGSLKGLAETDKAALGGHSNACLTYKNKSLSAFTTRLYEGSEPYWAIMKIAAETGIEKPRNGKWLITKNE